jgi:hypothetical protein
MKNSTIALLLLLSGNVFADEAGISASFVDPAWSGKKIPAGQQCQKFGGKGAMEKNCGFSI